MAVKLISPFPWAAWESPDQNKPPLTHTGKYKVVPSVKSRISILPPNSPGKTLVYWPGSARATPIVPGNGLRGISMPGPNSATLRTVSRYKYFTWPSWKSFGNCPNMPGILKLVPYARGIMRFNLTFRTSPGSAPSTKIGPVSVWGPRPGWSVRNFFNSSMVFPGTTWLCACIMVSITTVSPDLIVRTGGCALLNQPHWVVSKVAGNRCVVPGKVLAVAVDWANAVFRFEAAANAKTAMDER